MLKKRALGRTGIDVSEIGLGAWQLGEAGWSGPDERESLHIVDEALERGCTFIDTAPAYAGGRSEQLLGRALEGRRERVVLCTKFGYTTRVEADFTAARIEDSLQESLRRLRTDYVDILLIHSPPAEVLEASAVHFSELRRLRDAGLIRAYGLSLGSDTSAELRRLLATSDAQVVEVRFNAIYQEPLPAIEEAAAQGVGVIVKVPLESGWLSGRYHAQSTFSGVRSRWTPDEIARRASHVEQFEHLLPAGTSTIHGALGYVLAQPSISTVIPGTKSVEQLRDNLAAASLALPPEVVDSIRQLWADQLSREPAAW